jgi:hypothetical protein
METLIHQQHRTNTEGDKEIYRPENETKKHQTRRPGEGECVNILITIVQAGINHSDNSHSPEDFYENCYESAV